MTRWTLAGFMALGAVGALARAKPPPNPFAGSWSGTWSHVEDDDIGTTDWTISDAGRITGTAHSTTDGTSGTIVGHVGADGNLVIIAGVPSSALPAGASGYPHQGTAMFEGDTLVVSATGTGSGAVSFVAILTRN